MDRYKVTCLKCKRSDYVSISPDKQLIFEGMMQTPFLAARWRTDSNWGFECSCGNDNRIALKEERFLDQLVNGTPMGIEKIKASLKIPDVKQFSLEVA